MFCEHETGLSKEYVNVLENYLLSKGEDIGGVNFEFQQDNTPCHSSKYTMAWLNDQNIKVMKWPSLSHDLNIIENLWAVLVRAVYENNRKFNNVNDLRCAIVREWNNIDQAVIQNLSNSMENRVFNVIRTTGLCKVICGLIQYYMWFFLNNKNVDWIN